MKPWRNSVPAEIDLFDRVTVKPTGTILLKPPWLWEIDYLPPVEFRNCGRICFKFKDMNHKGVFFSVKHF